MRSRASAIRVGLVVPAAIVVPIAASAQGCGPTRLKVSEAVVVDVPPARLWALVGDFQNMSWNPTIAATMGSGGNDVDRAVRTVTLKGGAVFGESLYKYDARTMSYAYHVDKIDVGRLPVQNASATLDVVATQDGRSKLVWRAAFYRYLKPGEPAPDVADAEAAKAVATYFRTGLDGLKARLDPKT